MSKTFAANPCTQTPSERWRVTVRGVVQGVGFRPFTHRLATSLELSGWVRNTPGGVEMEVQGGVIALQRFFRRLTREAPPLARIDAVNKDTIEVKTADTRFEILATVENGLAAATMVAPDSSICADCLRELFTPTDRRYRYPFINCTHCGPRYTLTWRVPYDRSTTSMAPFIQCPQCLSEYSNVADRRFHAEPNACPTCGPQLSYHNADGQPVNGDPLTTCVEALSNGQIVAIKGLGGFHLACNARDGNAVARLRRKKARDAKPFAVMALNLASARRWCDINDVAAQRLRDSGRPIVLLPKKDFIDTDFPLLAPGMNTLGVMLPYTPLHYLLFHEALGRPPGTDWLNAECELLWVMTSANPGGEPLVIDNDEALQRLASIAQGYLMHDRTIVGRCDDSVLRFATEANDKTAAPMLIRRARGIAPQAISLALPQPLPSVLATGGYFKNTICVTRGDEAFLSPHIGSLDNAATCIAFDEMVERMLNLLQVMPALIAHDRHPDFYSTQVAATLAHRYNVKTLAVAHHHAHIAAVMAEHAIQKPVLGLAFDGVGLGDDGTAWGGEWLHVDGPHCQRIAHLAPLLLVGGDKAAREPWRVAAAALIQNQAINNTELLLNDYFGDEATASSTFTLLQRAQNKPSPLVPATTSMGRYFDAAAAALNICRRMSFEGQAAMQLESLAHRWLATHDELPVNLDLVTISDTMLDLKPLIHELFSVIDPTYGAALFHGTLIAAVVQLSERSARAAGLRDIVCAGGCFVNALLAAGVKRELKMRGYQVYQAQRVPANDGGLALGQAFIAAQYLSL